MPDSGIQIHGDRLKSLQPVFRKWIKLNRDYAESMKWRDCGWWSNERATTSILAAAAWMSGGVALEEFSTRKGKRKENWAGRCDLFFKVSTNKKFACEIKQVFFTKPEAGGKAKIKRAFESACEDAEALDSTEGRQLGICFVTPRFRPSPKLEVVRRAAEYVQQIRKERKEFNFDVIAWFFPKNGVRMEWKGHKRTCPGVIVPVREIKE